MDPFINKSIEDGNSFNDIKPTSNLLFGGLLLFFLFEYVRPGSHFPVLEAAKINTLIPISVFVFTFLSSSGRSHSAILSALNTKWFLFFIALFPIQVFTADVTLYVFQRFIMSFGYLLVYFVIMRQVTSIQRIKAVFSTLIFVHVLLIFLNPKLILEPENRNYIAGVTFLGDGNDFAWSVCIVVPFALFLVQIVESRFKKMLYLGLTCLLILMVVGSQSRGGSIALGASILYFVLKGNRKIIGLMGLGALVAIVLLFAPTVYLERMKTIEDYKTEGSAQGRIMAWNSAMRMAIDHPLIGVGAGHFAVKYGVEYRPPGIGRTDIPWSNAHSIYFLTLGEFGFTGMLFLLGLIITNMLRNERSIRNASNSTASLAESHRKLAVAMQASFIGFAVGGAFLSGLYYPHLYILAALNESVSFITSTRDKKIVLSG